MFFVYMCTFIQKIQGHLKELYAALSAQTHKQNSIQVTIFVHIYSACSELL